MSTSLTVPWKPATGLFRASRLVTSEDSECWVALRLTPAYRAIFRLSGAIA
ncbi:hypothetical protein [Pseudanabaena sp. FACHB-2040]|uniref:hypothetical protein n=1 Tax=Pseudanabaena sp. FACHB-2040 TaxID=2692859 RepID=UPI001686BA3A|nr:hypothetical protein [Pseudanabaena sp. FACHB-2040]MBD2259674.1 hypothetical protein [Pseudanabaena sp. FACHB-2040]